MNVEPVALLPLRLETRSDANGSVLRVRVFPDDIHLDALDTGVSAQERAAGEAYWHAVWLPPSEAAEPAVAAWAQLVRVVGARRARWVAEALRPTNPPPQDPDDGNDPPPTIEPPTFPDVPARTNPPARVRTLPTRFHAFAFQGTDVSTATGEPVQDELQVGLPTGDAKPLSFKDGVPIVADELRWLVDFERALEVGMGLVIQLHHPRQNVDRLVVLGVRDDLDPGAAAQRLGELLRAHAFTDGAGFVAVGTPTNNTDTDRSSWSRRTPPTLPDLFADAEETSNGGVLAGALGLPLDAFASLERAGDFDQDGQQAMTTALWATTWEVIFDKLTHPATPGRSFTHRERDALRDHAIGYVRARGAIPALRVGRQPYGILPTTAFAPNGYTPSSSDITDAGLSSFLANARALWRAGVQTVPTVMDGDLEQALPEILGSSPNLVGLRVRSLTKVNKCYEPLPGLLGARDNCATQEGVDQIAREFLGFDPTEVQSNGLLGTASRVLALPLTDDGDLDYIGHLIHGDGTPGQDAQSVLQALLGLASAHEAQEWARATGDESLSTLRELVGSTSELVDANVVAAGLHAVQQAPFSGGAGQVVDRAAAAIAHVDGLAPFDRGALAAAYPIDAVRPPRSSRRLHAASDLSFRTLGWPCS